MFCDEQVDVARVFRHCQALLHLHPSLTENKENFTPPPSLPGEYKNLA